MLSFMRSIPKSQEKNIDEITLQKESKVPPKPISILDKIIEKRENETEEIKSYFDLCKEVEFYPAQLFKKQLLLFFIEENIPVYDIEKVTKYLCHQAQKTSQRTIWIWRPLREKDVDLPSFKSTLMANREYPHDDNGSYRPEYAGWNTIYDKLIPMFILERVKKIENKFGDVPKFFVSDYQAVNPDPFIMVTTKGLKESIVFGMWDEPGF